MEEEALTPVDAAPATSEPAKSTVSESSGLSTEDKVSPTSSSDVSRSESSPENGSMVRNKAIHGSRGIDKGANSAYKSSTDLVVVTNSHERGNQKNEDYSAGRGNEEEKMPNTLATTKTIVTGKTPMYSVQVPRLMLCGAPG